MTETSAVERGRLGGRSRAKQQPPLFSTIQVGPKDRLTFVDRLMTRQKNAAVAAALLI
jgi:hypothetical protein